MKKKITLMMMVLCFLMSIPLKMMAETVTVHFIDKNNWSSYDAYVFDASTNKTISEKDHPWPGKRKNYTTATVNGDKVVSWTIDLGTCTLANARIVFNNGSGGQGNQYPGPNNGGFEVANNQYYNNNGKTDAPSEGGGSTGGGTEGGGGSTTEKWDTETVNRLKDRVYSQGFYLAGNFFSFQPKDGANQITYDDAVFKFQQQKNDATIETGKDYEVYKVEIPASLTAHAQVMYVDEFGNTKNIFGPGSAYVYDICKTNPKTDESTEWLEATVNACDPITQENGNYWKFESRNETYDEYSDGMYNLYIAVEPTTHTVKKWKIEHDSDRRVAYFISDAPNATAMPVYDAFDTSHNSDKFSNKFYASVNFSAERNYYVISNYLKSQDYVSWTEHDYQTKKNSKPQIRNL